MSENVKKWKQPIYLKEASSDNPAGNIFRELSEEELDNVMAGGTANSQCHCYSGYHSCGRVCTATSECPIATIICC